MYLADLYNTSHDDPLALFEDLQSLNQFVSLKLNNLLRIVVVTHEMMLCIQNILIIVIPKKKNKILSFDLLRMSKWATS